MLAVWKNPNAPVPPESVSGVRIKQQKAQLLDENPLAVLCFWQSIDTKYNN